MAWLASHRRIAIGAGRTHFCAVGKRAIDEVFLTFQSSQISVTFVALSTPPAFSLQSCSVGRRINAMENTNSRDESANHIPSFAERLNRLSKKRKELIRPVQEHPRDFVLLPIRELATKLSTDPATVLRIVRGLGFASYRNFKVYLHELSIASATSLESMRTPSDADASILSHGQKALEQDVRNLHALRNTLDLKRVAALAKRIHAARRILILGGDLAISLVDFLEYRLTLLGFPVIAATTPGHSANTARNCGKKDLVIAISFRRGLRQTVEGLQQAHSNGAYCVGITDTFISPIARFADECFLTPVEAHLSNSYTVPMSFLNVLLTVCAHQHRARTVRILKKADKEQRHGFRWYPD